MKYSLFLLLIIFACTAEHSTPESSSGYYQEKHRPQFHFSPEAHWMNDPNGMVFLDGEYHLFYQYYPDSTVWGPMHWGHAVSTDLVHWEHLPVALYPDSLGYIFSGSAVYDSLNTSGLGSATDPPLVAIFTLHDPVGEKNGSDMFQSQGIAFSTDRGRSWKKYPGNPVLKSSGVRDFRDPKVRWNAQTGKWIMTLAVHDHVSFYSSSNLIDWTFESDFGLKRGAHGGVWECPDLFPLQAGGQTRWVLLVSINPGAPQGGSGTQYFIGDFDGHTFYSDQQDTLWVDYGPDDYAGVTWNHVPDGNTYFIGWMSNWSYATTVPTEKWRSAMTVVRKLDLYPDGNQFRLGSSPVESLHRLRQDSFSISDFEQGENAYRFPEKLDGLELILGGEQWQDSLCVRFHNEEETLLIRWLPASQELEVDRTHLQDSHFSSAFSKDYRMKINEPLRSLHLYKDASSVEIFVNDGRYVMTALYFAGAPLDQLELAPSSVSPLGSLKIYPLQSIWRK